MLDIGWTEFFIVAVLALIVVGPKDLPAALRAVTKAIRKARGLAREFQSGIDEMVREAELDDIRKEMNTVRNFDPAETVKRETDPTGTLTDEFDPRQFNRDLMDRLDKQKKGKPAPTAPNEAPEEPAQAKPAESVEAPAEGADNARTGTSSR